MKEVRQSSEMANCIYTAQSKLN